ncbi:MAG: adenylosuccinate synthase [Bacteroidales bacterium]|jgi:adenylosuccinate synthase|nr:adenylosuccinate synthase [Bacteroidales bacterium]MBP6453561.1 adenylosuccinate synthase [Bacteroidales bacterium]MBP8677516.1 adenylosuccinate synthase [Bacteroidales bacterium]MBP9583879.1 adenylosuccinate synthase [Bacteroidales bacterium]MBP9978080.1 adenylosuccinate synthase [Bacteroidales bacterium]
MKVDVVLGLQWGDEGKGKIVDVLAKGYPVVARFQGGPNAGHSLHFEDKKFVLHTIPSGVFRKGTLNIIGNGVVIDPIIFKAECEEIEESGVPAKERIAISKKAHLILPSHRIIDAASEASKGASKIGSTLKGIGPTYMDKTGRNGLRVGDILADNFLERFNALKNKHISFLKQFDYEYDINEREAEWLEAVEYLKSFNLVDGEYLINGLLSENKRVLAEGAQGSLLDVDFGSYPFVTSSTTTCAGACTGLGISPSKIGVVSGIFKAYCTRVGSGPFPTELNDETGEELRKLGFEFGATTGRPRRTGWLDLVALKYAIMINGVDQLIMMKSDVMDTFETVKVATGYKVNGKESNEVPFDTFAEIEPVYKEFKGWKRDLTKITDESELPFEFMNYVRFIEKETGVPVKIISVGPDRDQTIIRSN